MKIKILGFNNNEIFALSGIICLIFVVTFLNLQVSLKRSRDAQRKADLRDISNALNKYQSDFNIFPLSTEGKIAACVNGPITDPTNIVFSACQWGWDALKDVTDASYPPYLARIPVDPHNQKGTQYFYISNGNRYQIFASLESSNEPEWSEEIVKRNLKCGNKICNFGIAFGSTPLDKTIEEYENELNSIKK